MKGELTAVEFIRTIGAINHAVTNEVFVQTSELFVTIANKLIIFTSDISTALSNTFKRAVDARAVK